MNDSRRSNRKPVPPVPVLQAVDLTDLSKATPPTADYVISGLLPSALVLLGGHGGAGKSIIALVIAVHVAAGVPFAGHPVRSGRVVFVSLEDPAQLLRWRVRRVCDAFGLDAATVVENLLILDGADIEASLVVEEIDEGRRRMVPTITMVEIADAARYGAVLVIIDNASDAFDGNENDRRQVRAFMRALAQLGRDAGAAVLLLAHIDKSAARYGALGNSYSGSTAWHNSARSRFVVTTEDGLVVLKMEKNNLGRLAEPLHFRWDDHGVLIPTAPGDTAANDDRDPHLAADNEAIMRCLARALHERNTVPTGRTGPSNTHAVLKTHPDLPGWAQKDKSRFWAAITRLQRVGWIERVEYTTASRNRSERWAIGPKAPDQFTRVPIWAGDVP
ncbi:AAA domain-containing protein [Pseudoxanthomonas sp. CF385]|uniref:AAA family ATPase n=1 Tax=Pseudoxanthomonas sp. CF385 TaxID=1881042 RepID=UPI0008890049|nr:AAA family ATPase [Pseudoxanthomonas sp. CF385]SDQ63900.1 AAA domain-containing protein [Pseudoxanthomonas sp. CF385]